MRLLQDIKNFDLKGFLQDMRFWFYLALFIFLLILFLSGLIMIEITLNARDSNWFFTILNSFSVGVLLLVIGIAHKGTTKQFIRYIQILVALFLLITLLGTINIKIHLNFLKPYLDYWTYSTSSIDGVQLFFGISHGHSITENFLRSNITWTTVFIGLSFLFESDTKPKDKIVREY